MMSEAKAMAEIDRTMTPRLAGVRSIAAPIGRLQRNAEQAAHRRHEADFGLAPMAIRHQIDVDEGPKRVAGVRRKEIERVERIRDRDHRQRPKNGSTSSPLTKRALPAFVPLAPLCDVGRGGGIFIDNEPPSPR